MTRLLQDICHEQHPNKGHQNILSPLQSFVLSIPRHSFQWFSRLQFHQG
uniref:Uncharacterized protein n=1 Tax=Arundo donax TaxID=35708 RepID=A0A0A9GVE3_ARUDO